MNTEHYDTYDQEALWPLRDALIGRSVVGVQLGGDLPEVGYDKAQVKVVLDDGSELLLAGNDGGCSCGAGDFELTRLGQVAALKEELGRSLAILEKMSQRERWMATQIVDVEVPEPWRLMIWRERCRGWGYGGFTRSHLALTDDQPPDDEDYDLWAPKWVLSRSGGRVIVYEGSRTHTPTTLRTATVAEAVRELTK